MNLQLDEANKDFNANKIISQLKPCVSYPNPWTAFNMWALCCDCPPKSYFDIMSAEERANELGWALVGALLKLFSEMSDDDFKKFKENYRKQVRQDGKSCDEQGNSNREKGGGEGNEVVDCGEGDPNC